MFKNWEWLGIIKVILNKLVRYQHFNNNLKCLKVVFKIIIVFIIYSYKL